MPFFDPIRIGASGAADTTYTVDRSLRFNRSDSAHLTYTPASASSDRTKVTISAWVKKCGINEGEYMIAHAGTTNNNRAQLRFYTSSGFDNISFAARVSGSWILQLDTTAKFRDPSAWYHIVARCDTTNGTANIYINGVEKTSFTTSTKPSGSQSLEFFNNSEHQIGQRGYDNTGYMNGYMAEINVIQGQALDASYFGETDAITGQWNPKKYTGGYGDGFYLNFSDNSGTTATTLGKDNSGNGNNFTPNNFATTDAVKDSPTNNFCTFNPLSKDGGTTLSEGNLKISSSNYGNNTGTFFLTSGKWYWEGLGDGYVVAICGNEGQNFATSLSGSGSKSIGYWFGGYAYWDGGNSGPDSGYSTTDIVAAALDMDNGTIKFYKNNTLIYDLTFGSGTVPDLSAGVFPNYNNGGVSSSRTINFNFGQDSSFAGNKTAQGNTDGNGIGDFYYAPPSGHLAICSANLPDPTILLPNEHFNTLLWSGNGAASRSITGLDFQPDWVWLKSRTNTDYHQTHDSVRGIPAGVLFIESAVEDANYPLDSFDSDGFTTSADASDQQNTNGQNYVAWNWNAGNTDGKTYTVTVVSDSGNKYRFDGFGTSAVTLDLAEGGTYIFNYPSAHPLKFSTTSDGTHGGGSEYTTGVTHNSSTQVTIVVAASAPTLYYYCSIHSGMGGAINTNSSLGSSNFDGTLQATVKANATAGFSIGLFTAQTSGSATVGHGLGVAPDVYITKSRTLNGAQWVVYHRDIGENGWVYFETDGAAITGNSVVHNPAPTSSVFTYGSGLVNHLSNVFYAFSEVSGFSKFGSYTGNGSTDGTFVFTNFRPAVIILKRTNSAAAWVIHDNKRSGSNPDNDYLHPDNSQSESDGSSGTLDILSNGFKLRMTAGTHNGNGDTFIYLAFAESPFRNARAR